MSETPVEQIVTHNVNVGITPETTDAVIEAGEKVAGGTVDAVTALSNKVLEGSSSLIETFRPIIEQYGGEVADFTLLFLRVDAAQTSLFPALLAGGFVTAAYKLIRRNGDITNGEHYVSIILKGYSARTAHEDRLVEKLCGDNKAETLTKEKKAHILESYPNIRNDSEKYNNLPSIIGFVSAALGACCSFVSIINFWAWIGLFYPALYAAHLLVH